MTSFPDIPAMTIHSVCKGAREAARRGIAATAMLTLLGGCSLSDLVDVDPTSVESVISAKDAQTYPAAVMLYGGAVSTIAMALSDYSFSTGLWTDELTSGVVATEESKLDARTDSAFSGVDRPYGLLQAARSSSVLAIAALRKFPSHGVESKLAELYAIQGFTLVLLAEGYCAGVPISNVSADGDIQNLGTHSTEALLTKARALFDTALTFSVSNAGIQALARIGHARANLNLGQFSDIPRMVESVPFEAMYRLWYSSTDANLAHWSANPRNLQAASIKNEEGRVGLRWIDGSNDPRIPTQAGGLQGKYWITDTSTLANGIEARLMLGEAQLQAASATDQRWLETLNALRATQRTLGGVRLLPDLSDPGTPASRVDLFFRDRALWLYLTGHRQGDLRRLIRQYGRVVESVYPQGEYPNVTFPTYSANVVFPIRDESTGDPVFGPGGCHDFNP